MQGAAYNVILRGALRSDNINSARHYLALWRTASKCASKAVDLLRFLESADSTQLAVNGKPRVAYAKTRHTGNHRDSAMSSYKIRITTEQRQQQTVKGRAARKEVM